MDSTEHERSKNSGSVDTTELASTAPKKEDLAWS